MLQEYRLHIIVHSPCSLLRLVPATLSSTRVPFSHLLALFQSRTLAFSVSWSTSHGDLPLFFCKYSDKLTSSFDFTETCSAPKRGGRPRQGRCDPYVGRDTSGILEIVKDRSSKTYSFRKTAAHEEVSSSKVGNSSMKAQMS